MINIIEELKEKKERLQKQYLLKQDDVVTRNKAIDVLTEELQEIFDDINLIEKSINVLESSGIEFSESKGNILR